MKEEERKGAGATGSANAKCQSEAWKVITQQAGRRRERGAVIQRRGGGSRHGEERSSRYLGDEQVGGVGRQVDSLSVFFLLT